MMSHNNVVILIHIIIHYWSHRETCNKDDATYYYPVIIEILGPERQQTLGLIKSFKSANYKQGL